MNKSAEDAKAVVALITAIADASQSQAISVSQIDQGVDQISSVVQTTAATAEESAATSEELSAQAVSLTQAISRFKLSEDMSSYGGYNHNSTSHNKSSLSYRSESNGDYNNRQSSHDNKSRYFDLSSDKY